MRSTRAREKRHRLILSLRPCLKNTAMLMQLAGKPTRKRAGMMMADLILSKRRSVSTLTRLWGLSHGVVAFKARVMQLSGTPLTDWLTSSTVGGNVAAVCVKPLSCCRVVAKAVAAVTGIGYSLLVGRLLSYDSRDGNKCNSD